MQILRREHLNSSLVESTFLEEEWNELLNEIFSSRYEKQVMILLLLKKTTKFSE